MHEQLKFKILISLTEITNKILLLHRLIMFKFILLLNDFFFVLDQM